MNKQREELDLALEALQNEMRETISKLDPKEMVAIREALAEPEQEPVAWMCPHDPERETAFAWRAGMCESSGCGHQRVPLYTAPPQRKPLTDEEIDNLELPPNGCTMRELVRAVERAHGIGEA